MPSSLRLLPLALLVFVAGCDSVGLRADDVRRGLVYELVLEDSPATQPDGNDWDSGITQPNPDIYLVIETADGRVIAETEPLANVDPRDLPVIYPVPSVEIGLDEEIFIVAFDDDGLLADEFMDEIGPVFLRDYLTDDLDESFRVFGESGEIEVRMRVEWDD